MKMNRKEKERQVLRWVGAMQDRELTEQERCAMNNALSTDAEMRDIYLEMMHMESCLAASIGVGESTGVLRFPSRRTVSLLRLAACFAGALLVGYWAGNRPEILPDSALEPPPAPAHPLAVFLPSADAQWKAGRELQYGDSIGAETIELTTGRARLNFFSGAVAEVEAPARFDLRSDQHLHLYSGKAVSETYVTSVPFKLTAAQAAFVDVGTMFAVNAGEGQNTEMHVYEGEVIASSLNESQTTERDRSVTQNQTLQIDRRSRQLSLKETPDSAFASLFRPELKPRAHVQEYAAAVHASQPDYYWTFEQGGAGQWASEGLQPLLLKNVGQTAELRTGNGNTALYFPHRDAFAGLMADEDIFLGSDSAFSLEFWVCPEKIQKATLASCYLLDTVDPNGSADHLFLIETKMQASVYQHVAGSIRSLYRPAPGRKGGVNLFTAKNYVPTRWIHLVYTRDADRVCFYVNGALERMLPLEPGEGLTPNPYRLAFCEISSPEKEGGRLGANRPYIGMIDEIAFYRRALDADEVRRHYQSSDINP